MITEQSIRQWCVAHCAANSGDFFYCLADHAGMPGLHSKLIRSKVEWISLFEGTKEAAAISVAPLLVRIETEGENIRHSQLWEWVAERGIYASSLILLASPLPVRELAQRLTARLNATISEGMNVLLRFYDPRIFEQLMIALSKDQKRIFLGPANCWWYADRRGRFQFIEAKFCPTDNFYTPLALTVRQEQLLVDASEPDQVDEQLRLALPTEYACVPLRERHEFIVRNMAAAQRFKISSTRELALFCSLTLFYGEAFAESSEWRPLLSEIVAEKRTLTDVVADLKKSTSRSEIS
jgi:hypothetical protein